MEGKLIVGLNSRAIDWDCVILIGYNYIPRVPWPKISTIVVQLINLVIRESSEHIEH